MAGGGGLFCYRYRSGLQRSAFESMLFGIDVVVIRLVDCFQRYVV